MKKYAVQKQLIPTDQSTDPNWAKRQVWVYKLNSEDQVDESDDLNEVKSKRDELESNDPTSRVYRVVERLSRFDFEVIE